MYKVVFQVEKIASQFEALRYKEKFLTNFPTVVREESMKNQTNRISYKGEVLNTSLTLDDVKRFGDYGLDLPALIVHGWPNLLSESSRDFSAAFHCSISPINFSGRVDRHKLKVNPNVEKMWLRKSRQPSISPLICSGVQNMCASSCWKRRTRVRPVNAPDSSFRCRTPKSAKRSGSSRQERFRLSNSKLNGATKIKF